MITFKKGNDEKFVDERSALIEILKATGWVEKEEKETKNGKSSKSSN